ncbi:hypothetical protein ACIBCA_36855 [Kitasatospora sp. NPDC051170]|uniref:hypothetical protein n=1 Tax=Kitasatospora sp. NPDC051170 TaxID=3364056 RepID=UPI0037AFF40D
MPTYEPVPEDRQLPKTTPPTAAAPAPKEVPIATTIPYALRRQLTLALAVHDTKLKDAVAQALTAWVAAHPPNLADTSKQGS